MNNCPYCGISIGNGDYRCWYCGADLSNRQNTNEKRLKDFLAFPEEARDIIGEYGNLLDEMGEEEDAKLLCPISKLPYPKTKIENALKIALGIAKDKTLKKQLEMVMVRLEDFIPDDEVPEDPDDNFKSWLSRKDWTDPKMRDFLAMILTQHFIKEYGDNAEQKVQEFIRDFQKTKRG